MPDFESLTAAELEHRLGGEHPPLLLDVRLEEDYAAHHLPGAKLASMLKVDFIDQAKAAGAEVGQPVVVYGWGEDSSEARCAADKLVRAGIEEVLVFKGGLAEWIGGGRPVEGSGQETDEPGTPKDGPMPVDLDESRIEWTGRNLLNHHHGTVPLSSGRLEFLDGRLAGGEFVIDLRRIHCADLEGQDSAPVLIAHLESEDFFDVANHPEARLSITRVEELKPASPGAPNLRLEGELMLRGEQAPLVIDAVVGIDDQDRPIAQALLTFDRTIWGVIYGSGRFFRRVAGNLVNDLIELQVKVVGTA